MGDTRNEEGTDINGFRIVARSNDRMPVDGVHVARRSGEPDVPAGASRCCLPGAMPDGQCL